MLATSTRLLKVLSLLQARRFWRGAELATELGVTTRSVRRDVERLRSLGYPVHATGGVGGGYALGAGKELPPLPLDDEEAVAVAIGLRAAATGPVKGLEHASVTALGKLEQVLPKRLRRRVQALQAVSVDLGDAGPTVESRVLAALAHACREGLRLRFEYGDRRGAQGSRQVEPYRLVHASRRWYLLAYDLDRSDWRTFRVDRVASAPSASGHFRARPLPAEDVAAYVSRSLSTEVYPVRATVTVHAPAAAVRKKWPGLAAQVQALDDGRCRVTTGAPSLDAMVFHLGFLGCDFEVQEPPELVAHLRALSGRLARAARRR